MSERYETWHPRFWDNLSRALGFTLIVWEAVKADQSHEILGVGLVLLLAPAARRKVIDKLLDGIATQAERGKWDDEENGKGAGGSK